MANFGLIDKSYQSSSDASDGSTQWQKLKAHVDDLNKKSPQVSSYKLLFLARHGEGWHNRAEAYDFVCEDIRRGQPTNRCLQKIWYQEVE